MQCNYDGRVLAGRFKPSSDTATHGYIYRHMPSVGGIVHTHSAYATAWAANAREIPCILTAMADEFGGPIPCGGFAMIGGEEIGHEVVRVLTGHRSPAIILQNHGVFTVGATPRAALKAAVMCEDVARTAFLAHQLGEPRKISVGDIDRLYERYTHQVRPVVDHDDAPASHALDLVRLRLAAPLRPGAASQVAQNAQSGRQGARRVGAGPAPVRVQGPADHAGRDPRHAARRQRRRRTAPA